MGSLSDFIPVDWQLALSKFFANVSARGTWIRIGTGLGGFLLIGIALWMMVQGSVANVGVQVAKAVI